MHTIDGFVEQGSVDLQGQPSMATASEVIALRTKFATSAFGGACQLFQFAVKFFDLPAQLVRVLSDLRDHGLIQRIGDDPVDVAVYGNYLEQSPSQSHFLDLDNDAIRKLFVVPSNLIEMDIAIFCAQTDHAVGFACGVKGQSQPVNQLQVLPGASPTVK